MLRRRRLHGVLAIAGAYVLSACPTPTDGTPQIAVTPGAAARIGLIPSKAPRRDDAPGARAHAHPLEADQILSGPNATGKVGDWMLENDEVVFVVDGLGGGVGFAESGGNIVDAADARARVDELGQVFTYFGAFPRQAVYQRIDARDEPDGSAWIEARGHELYEPGVEVVTRYTLAASDRAVLLRTTLTNRGRTKVAGLGLGDAIQWGGGDKYAPGKPRGFKGPTQGSFIGAIGARTSYAITGTDGIIEALSGGSWTDTLQAKDVELAPSATISYERVFVVGERPDASSLVAELARAAGVAVGHVEFTLVDERGVAVPAVVGATVALSRAAGASATPSMTVVAAASGESFGADLPEGAWFASFAPSVGRRGDGKEVPLTVSRTAAARARLTVGAGAELTVGCDDAATRAPTPCKVTVEGVGGTAAPDFGPSHVAHAARQQLFPVLGDVAVPLAPGSYRLTFSRGPEFDAPSVDVVLAPGEKATARRPLRRVLDTAGYVAADTHQHTVISADSAVATRDRVLANVAEGVEVAVASEHNVVADLTSVVRSLGLSDRLVELSGNELTTDASKKPWGHANVYPLAVARGLPRGGATVVRDRLASEVLAEVRRIPGAHVVQINHPRSGSNGYFDQLGFDRASGVGKGEGYDPTFDTVEVWNGRDVAMRERVFDDFMALLRTGHPTTPMASTDTHGVVGQEAGYPRTWVRVAADDALGAWDGGRSEDFVRSLRERRDVILSNGPFVRVSAGGVGIGGVARARGGVVEVGVTITAAPWVEVDTVELRTAAGATVVGGSTRRVAMAKTASGASSGRASFQIRARADDAFVVVVHGDRPMRPMLAGDEREIAPWAMTGAIWIDADGDGRALGR